jgi:hypothetical protein
MLPGTGKRERDGLRRFPPRIKRLAGQITLLWRQGRIPRFEIWRFDVMLYSMAEY